MPPQPPRWPAAPLSCAHIGSTILSVTWLCCLHSNTQRTARTPPVLSVTSMMHAYPRSRQGLLPDQAMPGRLNAHGHNLRNTLNERCRHGIAASMTNWRQRWSRLWSSQATQMPTAKLNTLGSRKGTHACTSNLCRYALA